MFMCLLQNDQVVNPHLLKDLTERGLWSNEMKNQIIAANGSIQSVSGVPADIKALYKTVWEVSQRVVIDMAADRGAFIDQSQSLNLHVAEPSFGKLTSMHFYGWKQVRLYQITCNCKNKNSNCQHVNGLFGGAGADLTN